MSEQDLFIDIQIKCPSCRKKGMINVNKKNFTNNSRGITAVHISNKIICDHSFVAYLDKNLVVRDSFIYDFEVSLPQFEEKPAVEELDYGIIDTDILKLNILPTLMINILRGIVLGKKLIVIKNDLFLKKMIFDFLKIITDDSFQFELTILTRKEYLEST